MVGIVILNWNGLDETLRCLKSLKPAKDSAHSTEVIVIDNGSSVDPGDDIKRNFPGVDYIRLEKNVGYAAGCNLGAKRALSRNADFVLFLNNDTVVEPNLIQLLIESFRTKRNLGLISPLIRRADDPPVIEFSGGNLNYSTGKFQSQHSVSGHTDRLRSCDYVSGCCLLISRKALEQVGFFDETYFAYFEDTDLSIRARSKGFEVACRTDISITHKGSATTRWGLTFGTVSPLKHYLIARNRIILIRKHAPLWSRIIFFGTILPFSIAYYLAGFLIRLRMRKACAFLNGVRDGFRPLDAKPAIGRWH